jgi:hopanoid biosynthesis associated radical SAM protein HpnH
VFLGRRRAKELFRGIFRSGDARRARWRFNHSALYLSFLAGNESYQCSPWSTPTYNVFGWQKPCYLLVDEGFEPSFDELMSNTRWDAYGVGRHDKCANCMAHCGYEGTAVEDTLRRPWRALGVWLKGPRTNGAMAADVPDERETAEVIVLRDLS